MKIRTLIVSLAVIATSSSVLAESQIYPYVDFSGFQSTKSRAEVMAELKEHQTRVSRDHEYPVPDTRFVSTKSRAEVAAELKQSIEDGTYARMDFETAPPAHADYRSNVQPLARTEEGLDASK